MPRSKPISLELFAPPPMTRARALELVLRYPIGSRLKLEMRRCSSKKCPGCRTGGKGHGPYWAAWVRLGVGQWRHLHVGGEKQRAELEQAWAMLVRERNELLARIGSKLARSPEARELAALDELLVTPAAIPIRPLRRRRGTSAAAAVVELTHSPELEPGPQKSTGT